jgi:hypothetical protein
MVSFFSFPFFHFTLRNSIFLLDIIFTDALFAAKWRPSFRENAHVKLPWQDVILALSPFLSVRSVALLTQLDGATITAIRLSSLCRFVTSSCLVSSITLVLV